MGNDGCDRGPAAMGGPDRFWTEWRTHEPTLRRLCASMLRGRHDVIEDVLGTALARGWDQWSVHEHKVGNPGAWLSALTRRVCQNYHRSERRRKDLLPRVFECYQRHDEPPDKAVERRMILEDAMREIDRLPPAFREPFIAYTLHGKSYDEIGETYGMTPGAARQRVGKARRMLAEALGGEKDESAGEDGAVRPHRPSDDGNDDDLLGPLLDEIAWRLKDTCVVQINLPTGGTLEYHAVFDDGLTRRKQRISSLEEYVAEHERGWAKRFELANLLIADNRIQEAEAHLRRVLAIQPRHLASSLRLGQLLVLARRHEDAVAVYQDAQRHVIRKATWHHLQGLIERARSGVVFAQYAATQRVEHLRRAAEAFKAAIADEPDNLSHYHELGLTYETWGKPVDALNAYDAALAVDPDDVFALARGHNSLLAQGRYEELLPRLERAVELDPNYAYAAKLLVDRRAMTGLVRGDEGRKTLALAQRLVERNPNSADAMDARTRYYERRGEHDRCVALWREFLTRNPTNAKGWTFLGSALERTGDLRAAADAYIVSQSLDPAWLDVYWRGLRVLAEVGDTDRARRWIAECLQRFPNHWDVHRVVAEVLCMLGDDAETYLAMAYRAVEMAPDIEPTWRGYGELLLKAGRPDQALEALRRGWEITQQAPGKPVPWALLEMGKALNALGRNGEARKVLRHCERLLRTQYRQNTHLPEHIGLVRMEMGQLDAAERAFLRARKAGSWMAATYLAEVARRRVAASA